MPIAEIITIGTELLLGEILDTNSRYLARVLRDHGIDLYRTMTVGDNTNRIASAIREALERAEIVITTGGLGPTVDDPTRQAVAQAVGVELEYRPELWEQILNRFKRYGRNATENNKRQAYIPAGALPIENAVGTAPAFVYETGGRSIISLPGVPREMEYLTENAIIPYLTKRYDIHGVIKARVLHLASIGESQVDDVIGDLETLSNPTLGLLAHPGQVDVRITAKAGSDAEAENLIDEMAQEVYRRLGYAIFGEDHDTLENIVIGLLQSKQQNLVIFESGLAGELVKRLAKNPDVFLEGRISADLIGEDDLRQTVKKMAQEFKASVGLGVSLLPGKEQQNLFYTLITPSGEVGDHRSYGGPPQNAPIWASNLCMDLIRREIGNRSA